MQIKNIVFDMGNVLINYNVDEYIQEFTTDKTAIAVMKRELFKSIEWLERDNGDITVNEAIESVSKRVPDEYKSLVIDLLHNWHHEIYGNEMVEQLVARLSQNGYDIYLLSNTSDSFHDFKKNIPALAYFKKCFLSCDCHMLKPEKEIYLKFFEEYNLKPEECFFIDDMTANIYSAGKLGMKGHIFDGDITALERSLQNVGVQI